MKYTFTCTNIRVHVCMCTYAIREEYSPISGKYSIPRVRVHVCMWAAKGLAVDCRRKDEVLERCFRDRKCKEEREI